MNVDELDGEIRRALVEIGDAAGVAPRFDQLCIDDFDESLRREVRSGAQRLALATAAVVVVGAALWAFSQVPQRDDVLVSTASITPPTGTQAPTTAVDAGAESSVAVADPSLETRPTGTDSTSQPTTSMLPDGTPIAQLAIGDSVMLGAAVALEKLGLVVDAEETQTFESVLQLTGALNQSGRLGNVVVIGLGMTGITDADAIDGIMADLTEVPSVFFLTFAGDRPWATAYNDLARSLPDRYENVEIIDWATKSGQCTGDCFAADGLHLAADGREYYARIILDAIAEQSAG